MKEKKVPQLRFPEFKDDWEQRKLGVLVQFSKGTGYSKGDLKESGTPIILYGRLYTKYETVIEEVDTFADEKPASVFSHGGEVIVPASGETAEDISIASVVEKEGVLLGGDLNIISPNDNIDSAFLAISISNGKPHTDMAKMAQGKSVVHLHNSDLEKIDLFFPSLSEQVQISTFFSNLDSLITLHQRKLDHLLLKKKSLLQKMFPKEGEKVPELRFSGFTEDWVQRKLSELGNIVTGSTPSTQVTEYYSNTGIPWVTPSDISDNVTYNTEKKLSEKGQQVGRIVPKNTILVTCIASIGKNTMLGVTGSFNQQINGLTPNESKYNPYFLFTESSFWSAKMKKSAAAGMMQIVNRTEFSKQVTMIPSLSEQQQIGALFRDLDDLIDLHQRKLEHLSEQKKTLLQQMFV